MNTFSDLGLAAPILRALNDKNYHQPTPIQLQAIPHVIAKNDIFGIAQTGTGKTAAFALPLLHRLATDKRTLPHKGARILVLSPTRELASQLAESFKLYASNMQIKIATVFGGVRPAPQAKKLMHGVDILIATPGRLLDHVAGGAIQLGQTEVLVLDEADQMLDLGFVKPIRTIVSKLPEDRQTLFFSATLPASISQLARDFLRHPKRVSVAPVASTARRIDQRVIHIDAGEKRAAVANLIESEEMSRIIVFTRTKRGADVVARHLDGRGIRAVSLHGNKNQKQRERALEAFKCLKAQVLVATDIAARGIDIDGVSHVINYELPEVPEAYVHRIGRTARAGASGSAISLCDRSEIKHLRSIEKLTRQKIPSEKHEKDNARLVNAIAVDSCHSQCDGAFNAHTHPSASPPSHDNEDRAEHKRRSKAKRNAGKSKGRVQYARKASLSDRHSGR